MNNLLLETNLRVKFKNKRLLSQALTHRSYLNEDPTIKYSNERLEFLGDSVLSLVSSTYLYEKFPDNPEGKLTATRSILVQSRTLARIAKDLGIGEFLQMSKGEEMSGGRKNISILADTFEAIIGAIYLDQGFETATLFITKNILDKMDQLLAVREVTDFKSRLQELVQNTSKLSPVYTVTKSEGPDHAKTFYVEVQVGGKPPATGVGRSKQEAEQDAARQALEKTS